MKKICILREGKGLWKEHGQMAYSGDLLELYNLIKDKDFEIVIGLHNDFEGKWDNIKRRLQGEIKNKKKLDLNQIEKIIEEDAHRKYIQLVHFLYEKHNSVLEEYFRDVLKTKLRIAFV